MIVHHCHLLFSVLISVGEEWERNNLKAKPENGRYLAQREGSQEVPEGQKKGKERKKEKEKKERGEESQKRTNEAAKQNYYEAEA